MTRRKSAKSGRPSNSEGEAKKALLAVTIRLLNAVGRDGATARAICNEAGVSAPVIYHHYGDLTGLHRAAIDESFRPIANRYRRGSMDDGPLEAIRESWSLFMRFAEAEPRMCRIMIEEILTGDAPKGIASTLLHIAQDIADLNARGHLTYKPEVVSQMLWVGALGSVGYISTQRHGGNKADPFIPEFVLDAILTASFKTSRAKNKAAASRKETAPIAKASLKGRGGKPS